MLLPGIPRFTGQYVVGCLDLMTPCLNCSSRSAADMGVFVRLFYPSMPHTGNEVVSTFLPERRKDLYLSGLLEHIKLKSSVLSWCAEKILDTILLHSAESAPLISTTSSQSRRLPVVVFSHGLAGQRLIYSSLCSQLASEGYLVAAVEHRDGSASYSYSLTEDEKPVDIPYTSLKPDDDEFTLRNTQIGHRTAEVDNALALLDKLDNNPDEVKNILEHDPSLLLEFKGRLDLSRPMIAGHSFGGATVINCLNKLQRFTCGLVLDAWMFPLGEEVYTNSSEQCQPVMFVNSESFHWRKNIKHIHKFMQSRPEGTTEMCTVRGTGHWDQCDAPAVIPQFLYNYMRGRACDWIPFHHSIRIHRQIISDFFNKFLAARDKSSSFGLFTSSYELPDGVYAGTNVQLGNSNPSLSDSKL